MHLRLFALLALGLAIAGCSKPPAPGGYRVYVTNEVSGDLTVIDSATLSVSATVPLGKRPRGIHASPDQQTLYVALSGTPIAGPDVDESTLPPPDKSADGIGVFDVKQNKIVRVIHGGSDPENFDLSKDGAKIYISNEDDSALSIVDIASGTVEKSFPVGAQPEGVRTTPDGKQVWVTSEETGTVSVLDLAAGKIAKTITVGHRPRSIAFTADGSRAYINAENDGAVVVVDTQKQEMIETIALGKPGVIKPMGVLLEPDGGRLFVSTGRGHMVFTISTQSNKPTGSLEVGGRPWGIALSPDAKTLFTANGPTNEVAVIDIGTNTVVKKIPAGKGPWGVTALSVTAQAR